MYLADHSCKSLVVDILSKSFDKNQSILYVVKDGVSRARNIRKLMEYSFNICLEYGEVWLSEDRKACCLILLPDRKKSSVKRIFWEVQLAFHINVLKTLKREARIKKYHPDIPFCYLWFIGVDPASQGQGIGSQLLEEVIREYEKRERPVYLETSTLQNIPWYEKAGFEVFREVELSYKLFLLKREPCHI
ncbi:GNAT family N-acetyltransferase [Rapidithrix thailandica]|uniref:GNAT family N-acetyltransferase n=1 Tax=Rapidithrix thailandica TaxID=413964 RepID=A0AAW9SF18_9BACT